MDSGSKDTADRHEAEDRGADGLADRTVKKKKKMEQLLDRKRSRRGAGVHPSK